MSEPCPVCGTNEFKFAKIGDTDSYTVSCPRCGDYLISGPGIGLLRAQHGELGSRQVANMSGWLRENQNHKITDINIEQLLNVQTPSFHQRADSVLLALEKRTEFLGQAIKEDIALYAAGWCTNRQEFMSLSDYLEETKRVTKYKDVKGIQLTINSEGWAKIEELKSLNPESQQCFVAMWFDKSLEEIYETVICEAIYEAGYKPHRVDKREHNDKIDDEIIAQIKQSRFILADFTGQRGGVYYEAGFAKGLGLEVIWTCREDEIDDLHFDIRQYNCIVWKEKDLDDFKKKIQFRIEAVLGKGTYKR